MRITSKPVLLGVPMLMVAAMFAVMALWATGIIGSGGGVFGGTSSAGTLVWNVEYWHRNADGEVLQHKKDHNTVTVEGLDAANLLLIDEAAALTAGSPTTDTDTYDQIALLNKNLATLSITTAAASTDILLLVDGGSTGNNTGQNNDGIHFNPADGLDAATGGGSGDGTVTLQFQAVGNPAAALQMRLVKSVPDDSAATPLAISLADTLAVIGINVDLADTDTLTITWTLNIS